MTLPVPIPWRRVRVMTSRKTNPVGTTWNPALRDGVADPDPYNGIDYGKYLCSTSSGFLRTILGKSLNLLRALRALENSCVLNEALGAVVPAYLKLKHVE